MSYQDLYKIENIQDKNKRLVEYAKHYQKVKINGLHYVNFDKNTSTISISRPNHRTHHLATSFLIKQKDGSSINTIRTYASSLKKFLDFLLIWDIDLIESDLMVVISGFISYLRCIDTNSSPAFSKTMIYYSTLTEIPLNESASSCGKVIKLGYDSNGFMKADSWSSTSSYQTIKDTVTDTIKYLKFLNEKTKQYQSINYSDIPTKAVTSTSMLSGTLGSGKYQHPDIDYLLSFAGFKKQGTSRNSISNMMVLNIDEINNLISAIPSSNYRDKLLFYILKYFGLREGEAAALQVDISNLSPDFIFKDKEIAKTELREKLKGDIVYNPKLNKWTCCVSENNSDRFDKQAKTGSRIVPLLFPKDTFEDALLYGLIQRTLIMKQTKQNHNFLLINVSNKDNRGSSISGTTVYDRFMSIVKRLEKSKGIDLKDYSPHSMRHFFATYLIKSKKYSILDVSKYLGHSGEETTVKTYYHYIDSEDVKDDETKKLLEKLKGQVVDDE